MSMSGHGAYFAARCLADRATHKRVPQTCILLTGTNTVRGISRKGWSGRTPRKPEDLESHRRLDFSYRRRVPDWPLLVNGRMVDVPVGGSVRASDGEALRQLAIAGAGLARLSTYHIWSDLDAGRLVPVLEKYNPRDMAPIHAVYLGKVERLPSRVRAVLDFLVAQLGSDPRFSARATARSTAKSTAKSTTKERR